MDSQYRQLYDTISSVTRITGFLNAAENTPTELRLTVAEQREMHNSSVLKVDPQKRLIVISRLPDTNAHNLLLQQRAVHIYYHVNGADISFTSHLLDTTQHNGQESYVIAFPDEIKCRQRRSAFRVHVSLALEVTASFRDHDGRTHVGQLRDLSAGGMKVQFTRVKVSAFEQQHMVPHCTIRLPNDTDIKCTFRVRHLQENARKNGFTMGGNFVALEQHDKRTLERFIASLERRTLRELRN